MHRVNSFASTSPTSLVSPVPTSNPTCWRSHESPTAWSWKETTTSFTSCARASSPRSTRRSCWRLTPPSTSTSTKACSRSTKWTTTPRCGTPRRPSTLWCSPTSSKWTCSKSLRPSPTGATRSGSRGPAKSRPSPRALKTWRSPPSCTAWTRTRWSRAWPSRGSRSVKFLFYQRLLYYST